MLKGSLKSTEEIWSLLGGEGVCPNNVYDVMRYLKSNYMEIKNTIKDVCFSNMVLLGDSPPAITPGLIVMGFIASSKGKFCDVVDMNCIDVIQEVTRDASVDGGAFVFVHQNMRTNFMQIDQKYNKMMIIAESLRNTTDRQIVEQASSMKNQLQSTVKGLGYTTYTSSMSSLIAYSMDNILEIRSQQKAADRKFVQYMDSMQSSMRGQLERQLNEYIETIFDPYIDDVITEIFNSFKQAVILDYMYRGKIIYG